jgi:hypothetical protein
MYKQNVAIPITLNKIIHFSRIVIKLSIHTLENIEDIIFDIDEEYISYFVSIFLYYLAFKNADKNFAQFHAK